MIKLVSLLALLFLALPPVFGNALQPAISPDGKQVAFCYQGDIWTVSAKGGRPYRITVHEGYDSNPRWSPDGERLAFQSDRYGNNDIYSMPSQGGVATRHTHHSATDLLSSYNEDGSLLFLTKRVYAQVEREYEIYKADPTTGTPTRFMDALGFDPVVSPDGGKIAFVRGTCRIEREAYRGPANRDIWIYDISNEAYTQVTDFEGNDFSPKWLDESTLLFISSREGKYNVFQTSLEGSVKQLTFEESFGVNSFDLSPRTRQIVYQHGSEVSLQRVGSKSSTSLDIDLSADVRFDPVVSETMKDKVDEYAVSPDGRLTAYAIRGDLFVTRNDKDDDRSVRITRSSSRERDPIWLNDHTILYVSDEEGQNDLYLVESSDEEEKDLFKTLKTQTRRLTETPEDEFEPILAPNGKRLVYRIGNGKLMVAEIEEEGNLSHSVTLLDGWARPSGISWSPDSRWIAYELDDLDYNAEIFIHSVDDTTEPVNVSMHPGYDSNPVWSRDGSKLGFLSDRNNGDADVWFAWLKKSDWEKSDEQWERERQQKDDKKKEKSASGKKKSDEPNEDSEIAENDDSKGDEEDGAEKEAVPAVEIDFDKIYLRLVQVTSKAGNEGEFVFDKEGEMVYYTIGSPGRQDYETVRNLYKVRWDGDEQKEVIGDKSGPQGLLLSKKGDHVYTLTKGGLIRRIITKDDKVEKLSVTTRIQINSTEEREQIYYDAWRALDRGFYDPNFHGHDFAALRDKYLPLAKAASTTEDFQYTFNLMLGQLNASHMGMRGVDNPKETQSQKTGLLGMEGLNKSNGFQLTRIVPSSPLAKASMPLQVDDVIASVDREPVAIDVNIFSLLADKADNEVLLEIVRDGESHESIVWPADSLTAENYDAWVESRRELVEAYSNGRLGYLHIRAMGWESFERFETELVAAGYGKEGIVIDVRYNGGGWTTDYLLAVLNVKQHAYTIPRGAASDLEEEHRNFKNHYPSDRLPLPSSSKPSIALCNESSYSNAEIFSHAYKSLGLGSLVGQPTFGAVISTGSYTLVDGSYVRMPLRGWFVRETELNMEHNPATPDILVENPPAYKARNVDPQVKRAVEELLKQIDSN
ncbi:MAG: PD40 domain-containing protein [Pirellulales bacterium]|nr:PD40 domain-containing protein [Pirellulales bacterium]